jgi:hypothetical protein
MDATDLFSYEMKMAVSSTETGKSKPIKLIVPHRAEWTISTDLMKAVSEPSTERHAAIMMGPGSELIDPGPADYKFRLRPAGNYIGNVTPGGQFTFTTEGLISAPPGATYDTIDFAIAISRYSQ